MLLRGEISNKLRSIFLAADARLCDTCYTDDQIWELCLEGGEPPAVTLQTTYGLRARQVRIFPRLGEGNQTRSNPAEFTVLPHLMEIYPNYTALHFSPFEGIDVFTEYWVPGSQVVCGRVRIGNQGHAQRKLSLEMVALLIPLGDGQAMSAQQIQVSTILAGKTGNITPVLFMTGGPQPGGGSFPSLRVDVELMPEASRTLTWALAGCHTQEESFDLARRTTARPWESELARIWLQEKSSLVEIDTGNPEWDVVLAHSQKAAFSLCLSATSALPHGSFVSMRSPDQGYSQRGDGSDYNHLWNGQTALDAYYLASLILPGGVELAKGWLMNFLAGQEENGQIDWKPGLGGQRSRLLAQPVLASLAWKIFRACGDRTFLQQVYQPLVRFLWSWFNPAHDRDSDGIPEWDHPHQSGFEENPFFDRWNLGGYGVEINTFESTALEAFLYRECQSLMRIGRIVEDSEHLPALGALAEHLRASVQSCWDEDFKTYRYRDRDTHAISPQPSITLLETFGSGQRVLQKQFSEPTRLILRLHSQTGAAPMVAITFNGKTPSGEKIEKVSARSLQWHQGRAYVTTQNVFLSIDTITIDGIGEHDEVCLKTIGAVYEDLAQLLPLWAGIPDERQASEIVEHTLGDAQRYEAEYGLRSLPGQESTQENPAKSSVQLIWNALIAEGMLAYGYNREASALLAGVMKALVQSYRLDGCLRRAYDAETGAGLGERDILCGLAPVGLFLDALGVHLNSAWQVFLSEKSPLPGPVTVKYQGLTLIRRAEQTQVTFADGQTILVPNTGPHLVSVQRGLVSDRSSDPLHQPGLRQASQQE
ncbi:MAG: hypothetical protein M1281_01950 [Chloroflexi bacterium]|nr:hypothetical protein [Chloroflexota bacterium]